MDIVYIVKQNWDNDELRYSLRSLDNIKHDRVFIVWHKPYWCQNVIHIPAQDPYKIKSLNALHKIKIACENEKVSEDFILMNDDFYILEPITIKYYHRWSIKEHLEYRINKWQENSLYVQNLIKTLELFPNWDDFSLHLPIIYNKNMFLEMCNKYDMTQGYLLRNLYCNHYWIKWEFKEDIKVYDKFTIEKWQVFLSSDDNMIDNKEFLDYINNKFPNICKYEKVREYPSKQFRYEHFKHLMDYNWMEEACLYRDYCNKFAKSKI